jgi:hypothetical protein
MRTGWTGRDPIERSTEYYYLALCALEDGDEAGARKHLREALALLQTAGATNHEEYLKVIEKLSHVQGRPLVAVA